jgi:hypothetical protein
VRQNGPQSWRKVYEIPLADLVSAGRFASK